MAIDNIDIVDYIGISPQGKVILSISDHLEWDDGSDHILLLQAKINRYLDFIESGEVYEEYPKAVGCSFGIQVIVKYPPSEHAKKFFKQAEGFLADGGHELIVRGENPSIQY